MEHTYVEEARVFKALSDENRLMVLEMLQGGEKCACVLLCKLNISQPTLSHHMKILVDSGIVSARKEGKWTYYSLCESEGDRAATLLKQLTSSLSDDLAAATTGGKATRGCC